jgi:hypothetical protein
VVVVVVAGADTGLVALWLLTFIVFWVRERLQSSLALFHWRIERDLIDQFAWLASCTKSS